MLFSDLYDWAGENRCINMYKEEPVLNGLSVEYSDCHNIDNDLEKLDQYFKSIKWELLSKKEIIAPEDCSELFSAPSNEVKYFEQNHKQNIL